MDKLPYKYHSVLQINDNEHASSNDYTSLSDFTSSSDYTRLPTRYDSIFTYNKPMPYPSDFIEDDRGDVTPIVYKFVSKILILISGCMLILTFPISLWFYLKKLPQHERLLVFRLGRLQPVKGPGTVILLPIVDSWTKVDMRMRAFSIPPQQFLTADNAVVELGADICFHVIDAIRSAMYIRDFDHACRTLGKTLLVNNLCKKSTDQLTKERVYINQELQENLNGTTLSWGIEVTRVDLSHVKILKDSDPVSPLGSLLSSLKSALSSTSDPSNDATTEAAQGAEGGRDDSKEINNLCEILRPIVQDGFTGAPDSRIWLEITGTPLCVIGIEIKSGAGTILKQEQLKEPPDVIITLTENDFFGLLNQSLTPLQAYISGRLQVKGDIQLLMTLEGVLREAQNKRSRYSVITV